MVNSLVFTWPIFFSWFGGRMVHMAHALENQHFEPKGMVQRMLQLMTFLRNLG